MLQHYSTYEVPENLKIDWKAETYSYSLSSNWIDIYNKH